MHFRMETVGLVTDGEELPLPLTQEELSDALGITPVHTNRVLKKLREDNLITFVGKTLLIHDLAKLRKVAGFDREYLHIPEQLD